MISELKFPFLVGDTTVLEVTDFKATCSSKGCDPFPEASGIIYVTGIVVDSNDVYPYKSQQTITYPVQFEEDGPITFFTFAGELDRPSADPAATGNYVLTGTPAGLSATGSLSLVLEVSDFPNVTSTGSLVVCA